MKVLLNCDLGEGEAEETTTALLELVDLANIACGGHAGDEATMRRVVREALRLGVQAGAHPGWADRKNFGRAAVEISAGELTQLLDQQVRALQRVAADEGGRVGHVKLHGALYHLCDERTDLAEACVDWMELELEVYPWLSARADCFTRWAKRGASRCCGKFLPSAAMGRKLDCCRGAKRVR